MEAILAQTLTDWELIICDSSSDDGSWEFFQKFGTDPRVRLYQVPRAGIYAGWNECLRRARGKYLYIATSDDTCDPKLFEVLVTALERHQDVAMATCNFYIIDEDGNPASGDPPNGAEIYGDWLQKSHRRHGKSEFVAACAAGPVWSTVTSFVIRSSLLNDVGFFPEAKQSIADFEWGIRASLFTDTIHIPQPLATWRLRTSQETRTLDWAKHGLSYVQMIHDTCTTYQSRVPSSLRSAAAYRRLIRPREIFGFDCLRLYPSFFTKRPLRTLRNLGLGLSRQPSLTLRHLFHGARWDNRVKTNLGDHVESFLRDFGLPPICASIKI